MLADSLSTTIEVSGLAELIEKVNAEWDFAPNYLSNIRIDSKPHKDSRLPEEWGRVSYYVVADFDDYKGQCIGMSNFYEAVEENMQADWEQCRMNFLAELKALLGKYDAKITPSGYEVNGLLIEIGGRECAYYEMSEFSPKQELTACNVFDYEKD